MAVITAKFGSRCGACSQFINPGDQINYSVGKKATHVSCPVAKVAKPAPKSEDKVDPSWRKINRPSRSRDDNYRVGDKIRLRSGELVIVTKVLRKWQEPDEDAWMCSAYVRAMTPEEAAPVERLRELREELDKTRQALVKLVETAGEFKGDVSWRDGVDYKFHASLAGCSGARLIEAEGIVATYASSYDDMPRWWELQSPEAVELFKRMVATAEAIKGCAS